MSDTVSQYFINETQKNTFLNNNSQIVLKGKVYGGDFNLDLNTYNYKGELFSFGGLGFKYHKKYKGLDYEIGRVRAIKEDNYTIGNQMLEAQISNYENTNGYIYEMNTKKFLLSGQYEYGIKENLKFDSKLSFDKIYSQPKNSIWQNIYSTDTLLTSGTWKNPNNLEGITSLNSFEHIKTTGLNQS